METKEFYELKKNSVKAKYRRRIEEISNAFSNEEKRDYSTEIDALEKEATEEIKKLKKEKHSTIEKYSKKILWYTILADAVLLVGIGLITLGLILHFRLHPSSNVWEILSYVFGGLSLLGAAVVFGFVMVFRDKKQKYFKDSYSEAELSSTKSMVHSFCEEFREKNLK